MNAVVYIVASCFMSRATLLQPTPVDAYLRDIKLRPSRPSQGIWMPDDSVTDRVISEDFQRLWKNHQLADLSIEVRDCPLPNGVVGKLVTYNLTERN